MLFGSLLILTSWLVWSLVGLALGPLLVLLSDRLPSSKVPVFAWPARCVACESPLSVWRLSATANYLFRSAACSACGTSARWRNLMIELATATAFGGLYVRFGFTFPLLVYSLYAAVFVVVFVVDLEHRLIPNAITYPGITLALLLEFVIPGLGGGVGLLGGLFYGGMFLLLYLIAIAIYRHGGAFGMGDVKLALLIGLITGLPGAVYAALLGTMIGGLLAGGLLMSRRASSKTAMPYGPALALGAMVIILWSPWIG